MFPRPLRRTASCAILTLALAASLVHADTSSSGNTGSEGNNAGANSNASASNTTGSNTTTAAGNNSTTSNNANSSNTGNTGGQGAAQPGLPALLSTAPRFVLQDDRGRYVSLDQFTNKIVVLEWFDPNNDYTRRDTRAGTNRALAAKYRDKGVVWLAVNSTRLSDVSFNHRWAETNKLGYPVLDDSHLTVAPQYGITTAPFYFIIDRHGHIQYEGPLDEDMNRALVQLPRDGRRNWIDRALGQLTTGQVIDRPTPRVYGDPLNQ